MHDIPLAIENAFTLYDVAAKGYSLDRSLVTDFKGERLYSRYRGLGVIYFICYFFRGGSRKLKVKRSFEKIEEAFQAIRPRIEKNMSSLLSEKKQLDLSERDWTFKVLSYTTPLYYLMSYEKEKFNQLSINLESSFSLDDRQSVISLLTLCADPSYFPQKIIKKIEEGIELVPEEKQDFSFFIKRLKTRGIAPDLLHFSLKSMPAMVKEPFLIQEAIADNSSYYAKAWDKEFRVWRSQLKEGQELFLEGKFYKLGKPIYPKKHVQKDRYLTFAIEGDESCVIRVGPSPYTFFKQRRLQEKEYIFPSAKIYAIDHLRGCALVEKLDFPFKKCLPKEKILNQLFSKGLQDVGKMSSVFNEDFSPQRLGINKMRRLTVILPSYALEMDISTIEKSVRKFAGSRLAVFQRLMQIVLDRTTLSTKPFIQHIFDKSIKGEVVSYNSLKREYVVSQALVGAGQSLNISIRGLKQSAKEKFGLKGNKGADKIRAAILMVYQKYHCFSVIPEEAKTEFLNLLRV